MTRTWTKRKGLVAAAVATTAIAVGAVAVASQIDAAPARGLDTSCTDYLAMEHDQQLAVIRESGLWVGYLESGVAYYVDACPRGGMDGPLKYLEG